MKQNVHSKCSCETLVAMDTLYTIVRSPLPDVPDPTSSD